LGTHVGFGGVCVGEGTDGGTNGRKKGQTCTLLESEY
jgi:hypothetical protein